MALAVAIAGCGDDAAHQARDARESEVAPDSDTPADTSPPDTASEVGPTDGLCDGLELPDVLRPYPVREIQNEASYCQLEIGECCEFGNGFGSLSVGRLGDGGPPLGDALCAEPDVYLGAADATAAAIEGLGESACHAKSPSLGLHQVLVAVENDQIQVVITPPQPLSDNEVIGIVTDLLLGL